MQTIIIFGVLKIVMVFGYPQNRYHTRHEVYGVPTHTSQQLPLASENQSFAKYIESENITPEPIITKQFFLHTAPEPSEQQTKIKHFVLGRPQKNYRVVFIKAPSSVNDNLKLSAEYAPNVEKTVIYVLSKKEEELNINDIATPAPTQPSKPEVHFIKYKTPEEAEAAQKQIQSTYDKFGGTSEFNNEGVIPESSVIGLLDGTAENGGYDYKEVKAALAETLSTTQEPRSSKRHK